ncbi:tripartite tricarboxylate transporter TctB family protein [Szabonella alba]|uniref:Tripartite tricarboxylate transporter TctB family protein n=1 Tax=Szabonella alba TaxID=2804194 RepID=A0A8K0V9Q9_9RHOB|nr:tripartite tricarboxylate transporter TctB family protein [Szabonella alba]MBL4918067.1 tripartite tricarboxylate transporter TctB family protein [Szabonella alba]
MQLSDALSGALFILLGLFMIWTASGFPAFSGQPYGASLLPTLLGCGFIIAGVLLGLRELTWRRAGVRHAMISLLPPLRQVAGIGSVILIFAAILGQILVAPHVGYMPVSVISLLAIFLWHEVRPLTAIIAAICTTLFCWWAFAVLLRVPLPRGFIEGFF